MSAWKSVAVSALLVLLVLPLLGCQRRKPPVAVYNPTSLATSATQVATVVPTPSPSREPTLRLPASLPSPSATVMIPTPTAEPSPTPTVIAPTATLEPPAVTPSPQVMVVQHVVVAGETLFRIAMRYKTTVEAILRDNPQVKSPQLLAVGTVLTIAIGNQPAPRTYTVQRGDTIYAIARKFGVSPQALLEANGLPNPNRIVVGQVLYIP